LNSPPGLFRIGEKLTYNVSFERFNNAGYAEIAVVSRGKLGDREAVELQSKFRTNELVSAAFYLFDESRTTFAAAESGFPLYIRKSTHTGVMPKETVNNFLTAPTQNFDLLSLIYRIRTAGGLGSFLLQEDEKIYPVTLLTSSIERIKTDAGEFETTISTVQSEYFTEKGIKEFRVNLSSDEQKVPVLIRFKTLKGEFRVSLASVQQIEGPAETQPTPVVAQTPRPAATPTPKPTPAPYLDNQPLSPNIPFDLGETLEYRISTGGQNVGRLLLQAKERRLAGGKDSLFLNAVVSSVERNGGLFNAGDGILAQVNPDTLVPHQIEIRFSGSLSSFNQLAKFDQERGAAVFGASQAPIPVNTHSLLSLAYAVRSFNLKPSKDTKNPINDTRVSVFYDTQYYVFTLRPADAEVINVSGERIPAQLITIITGNPQLDALNLRLWLSGDVKRTPLRLAFGTYQADLISETIIGPK
jgi:hypothetical protein